MFAKGLLTPLLTLHVDTKRRQNDGHGKQGQDYHEPEQAGRNH